LCVHAVLVGWIGYRNSPTCDEVGHLAAGIYVWKFAAFDVYRVNPPMVRSVASIPAVLLRADTNWSGYSGPRGGRAEWSLGGDFIQANKNGRFDWLWYFVLARWAVVPFSLVGGYVCYRWANELYGGFCGIVCLALWCSSPNVLAWASTICPDLPAAGLGVAACYVFWRWLKAPTWRLAVAAGVALGVAELTKTTWIVLFGVWPILWILWRWGRFAEVKGCGWRRQFSQLAVILLLGVYVINLGYGFEGSFRRLRDHKFVSRTLAGKDSLVEGGRGGNRWRENWLGAIPVPVPENYLSGIDLQKRDFEEEMWSYLRGEWRHGGWWHYYIYALAIKVPLGTWLLVLLALGLGLLRWGYATSWRDEMVLLAPIIVVLVLVSSQTGFNHHMRYVLPVFPFAFIWMSKVTRAIEFGHRKVAILAAAAVLWSTASSLYYYPHNLSYFNELVGGPKNGHLHLLDSNIDWGQDLLLLKRWLPRHPETHPIGLAYSLPKRLLDPADVGIEYTLPARGPDSFDFIDASTAADLGPLPGWYAIFVRPLRERHRRFAYFEQFEPVEMIGYTVRIYHITVEDANRVRRQMGLPEVRKSQWPRVVGRGRTDEG